MLQLIRDKSPYTVIILLIYTLLIKLQALAHPMLPAGDSKHLFYDGVVYIFSFVFGKSAFAFTFFAVVMLFMQAIYLNTIVVIHKLFNKTTYIPAYLYITFSSLHPSLSYFSNALLINWCMLGALHILLNFHHTTQPRKMVFNAGFLACMAALLHFPAVGYMILLMAALLLLRSFNPAEWVVGFMGYLTPVYFFAGVLFLFDKLNLVKYWPTIALHFPQKVTAPAFVVTLIIGIVTLMCCGLFALQAYISRVSVFMRRNWVLIMIYFFISILICGFTAKPIHNIWLVAMPASSLIIAHPLYLEKSKWFSNFAFYFSLLMVLVCQWVL
ncbi:MAG: hypothetical protein EOP51_06820 [Sphingobacteriales bacterium]|nr:MAG: hypothetical protein EOP51_06820 [Sphingobacteriales bacterium]